MNASHVNTFLLSCARVVFRVVRQPVWFAPALSALICYIFPNKAGLIFASIVLLLGTLHIWKTLKSKQWMHWSLAKRFGFICLSLLSVVFWFGNIYFSLLLWSSYPTQNFRLARDSRVGAALATVLARQYLTAKRADHIALHGEPEVPRIMSGDRDLSWLVKSGLMYKFRGPGPELSEKTDPIRLERFIHELAMESESVYRHYGTNSKNTLSYSGNAIESTVSEAIIGKVQKEAEIDSKKFNHLVVFVIDYLLNEIPANEIESRRIYLAAMLLSCLNFMTSGYSDMVPNSTAAMLVMALQFVIYIALFVLLLPLAWPQSNQRNHSDR